MKPRARVLALVIEELDGETLVYDLQHDEAHCLNRTAALVWRYCDGRTSVSRMAARLGRELAQPIDEGVVWIALRRLDKARLLRKPLAWPPAVSTSRRSALRRLGLAAALAPLVLSIIAPEAVAGASCNAPTGRPNGCPCTASSQCASARCLGNPKRCA
ncbi:MAG TPA: PqqD family protein [Vicinamibacteria bacterium]|nr:PqqD family protein [Vicinamibacteria bacterium]